MDLAWWQDVLDSGKTWEHLVATLPPVLALVRGHGFGYVRLLPGPVTEVRYFSSSGPVASVTLELGDGDVLGALVTYRPAKPNPAQRATAPEFLRPEVQRRVLSTYARAERTRAGAPKSAGAPKRQRPQISHRDHLASLALALAEIPKPWIVPGPPSTVLPTISELDELGF